jgi:hypothetical protein
MKTKYRNMAILNYFFLISIIENLQNHLFSKFSISISLFGKTMPIRKTHLSTKCVMSGAASQVVAILGLPYQRKQV